MSDMKIGTRDALPASQTVSRRRRTVHPVKARPGLSSAEPIAAHDYVDGHSRNGGDAEGGAQMIGDVQSIHGASLSEICGELRGLQKTRQFCIKRHSQCDRMIEQYLVAKLNLSNLTMEQQFAMAAMVRRAIEAGQPTDAEFAKLVLTSAAQRKPWDDIRKPTEKRMRELARQVPAWPFVKQIRGASDLTLAMVIAETTNLDPATGEIRHLSHYDTYQRVWKRCGLAVIDGERQRKHSGDAALIHAYKPQRRAEMWAFADPMFRAQLEGSSYRALYKARRAHTAEMHPDWSKQHSHNDAVRVMFKQFLADLWREWRRPGSEVKPDKSMAAAN